jgi:hypothetical protein
MAQIRRQGLTGMPPLPWSTGQPTARGVGGTVELAPDLATTCREPAPDPAATSHSPLERQGGGGHPTPEPDSTRWESTVDSISGRHHAVLTAKTPRGGGSATSHQNRLPRAKSEPPTSDPATATLLPLPNRRAHLATMAPHSSPTNHHTRGGRRPRCHLPCQPLGLCWWSTPAAARRRGVHGMAAVAARIWLPPVSP